MGFPFGKVFKLCFLCILSTICFHGWCLCESEGVGGFRWKRDLEARGEGYG